MDFLTNPIITDDMRVIFERQKNYEWLSGKTVLVTGAYGMLASYLIFFLIYLNEKERLNNGKVRILAQGRSYEKMVARFGDYCKKDYFSIVSSDISSPIHIDEKIDFIVHAASLASPQYYSTNPVDVIKPNALGTYYLLELAREKNVESFLFFSSGEIYGFLPYREEPYTEIDYGYFDCNAFRSCYGESKRLGETLCKSYEKQYGIPAKSVRIAHTYGPTLDLKRDQRVFSEFVRCAVEGKDIEMKSDGSATRMYCYIADAVDAFLRILHIGKKGEAYNMCNNSQCISVKELAFLLSSLFPEKNIGVKLVQQNSESYVECPVKNSPIMSSKKLEDLGWKPAFNIPSGFKRTIESFAFEQNSGEKEI